MGSSPARRTPSPRGHASGKWLLIDVRLQVLALGDLLYTGQSPKGLLTALDRTLLLPQIMTAARTRSRCRSRAGGHADDTFDVDAIPLLDPVDGTVTAIHACYVPTGAPMPVRPAAGAWQWQVDLTDREPRSATAIWSPEVFDLFELARPPAAAAAYPLGNRLPGPYFLHTVVDDAWANTVHQVIGEGVGSTTDRLIFRHYRVRAGGQEKNVRMAVRRLHTDPCASATTAVARGCTMEVGSAEHAFNQHGAEPIAATLYALSRDPLAVVNTDFFHLWYANRALDQLGLRIPADRQLRDMCHPDDLDALLRMLTAAADHPGVHADEVRARFAARQNGYRRFAITGTGITGPSNTGDVLCRFEPA